MTQDEIYEQIEKSCAQLDIDGWESHFNYKEAVKIFKHAYNLGLEAAAKNAKISINVSNDGEFMHINDTGQYSHSTYAEPKGNKFPDRNESFQTTKVIVSKESILNLKLLTNI